MRFQSQIDWEKIQEKIECFTSHKKKVAVAMGLAVLATTATGFAPTNLHNVRIEVDGKQISMRTTQLDPQELLGRKGITLAKEDGVSLTKTGSDVHIRIERAVPITVTYNGEPTQIRTRKATIGEALQYAGYDLSAYEAGVGFDAAIVPNMQVDLQDSAAMRERKLQQEIERRRAQQLIETSRGLTRYREQYTMEATAYLPSDGGGSGITASGIPARYGVAAVDPRVIPLGTRLYIPGYGEAIAADTGGAVRGERIDLCMESYDEAIQFGRRDVDVYVLED